MAFDDHGQWSSFIYIFILGNLGVDDFLLEGKNIVRVGLNNEWFIKAIVGS